MRRVLVFGTFDTYHAGHDFFLEEAGKLGDQLYVAVARDAHVRLLKKREPERGEEQRVATVKRNPHVFAAQLSDETLGTYGVIREINPNVIALGYDQKGLAEDLKRWIKETGWQGSVVQIGKQETYVSPNLD